MQTRRLPVYLVLDCSESMIGEAIEEVQIGVDCLLNELRGNPNAVENTWISVITFSNEACLTVPLTDLSNFNPFKLRTRCGTALGGALSLLGQCLSRDLVKTTSTQKGDYRPFVFLLTDGQPTDDWEPANQRFKKEWLSKLASFYAIGCGPDMDIGVLRDLSDVVFLMQDLEPGAIGKLFFWLTATIQSASESIGAGNRKSMPHIAPPAEVMSVPKDWAPQYPGRQEQVFVLARCSKTKKPYLMRFRRFPDTEFYLAVKSHPLENEQDGFNTGSSIDATKLRGCPVCPYCSNGAAVACACGTLMCCAAAEEEQKISCPACSREGMVRRRGLEDDPLNITQSLG